MKRFAILAAAALLGATGYVNAETVLSGPQMDQISAGVVGSSLSIGDAVASGNIGSLSSTASVSIVDLLAAKPFAYGATNSAAVASSYTAGGSITTGAFAASSSASATQLSN